MKDLALISEGGQSEREPSMRASELKSDFNTDEQSNSSNNVELFSKASKSKYSIEQSFNRIAQDDTSNIDSVDAESQEVSFNKFTPTSRTYKGGESNNGKS